MTINGKLSVAVVGAGMGGLTVAATLRRIGADVQIYEQAPGFARVGAGIQMLPNSMKVLRSLGLEDRLRSFAFEPGSYQNRMGDTGELFLDLSMSEDRYGAPYLCMHRGDLHESLLTLIPPEIINLDKKLVGIDQSSGGVTLSFADGSKATADAVIAADGLHSTARDLIIGPESPRFSGRIAYRAVFSTAGMPDIGKMRTKWWGTDRHIVIYYTKNDRSEIYFVTSVPEPADWLTPESWSAKGDINVVREAYAGFHPDVRAVLDAAPDCHKWAILERDPLPTWSDERVVLLGDACHPMTPYMAQGAAQSIEDAAILARCIDETQDVRAAFELYEAHRKPRTTRIQEISSSNGWLGPGESSGDTTWVYGYDALTAPLSEPAAFGPQEAATTP